MRRDGVGDAHGGHGVELGDGAEEDEVGEGGGGEGLSGGVVDEGFVEQDGGGGWDGVEEVEELGGGGEAAGGVLRVGEEDGVGLVLAESFEEEFGLVGEGWRRQRVRDDGGADALEGGAVFAESRDGEEAAAYVAGAQGGFEERDEAVGDGDLDWGCGLCGGRWRCGG